MMRNTLYGQWSFTNVHCPYDVFLIILIEFPIPVVGVSRNGTNVNGKKLIQSSHIRLHLVYFTSLSFTLWRTVSLCVLLDMLFFCGLWADDAAFQCFFFIFLSEELKKIVRVIPLTPQCPQYITPSAAKRVKRFVNLIKVRCLLHL